MTPTHPNSAATESPARAPETQEQQARGDLWCMFIKGPDEVRPAPNYWTALAWAAEMNGFLAARAVAENWAADDNWPLTQAEVRRWGGTAEEHAKGVAAELAERAAHQARRDALTAAPAPSQDAAPALGEEVRKAFENAVTFLEHDAEWDAPGTDLYTWRKGLAEPLMAHLRSPAQVAPVDGGAGPALEAQDWSNATLVARLRSYPAVPPGADAFSVRYVCALMEEAASALSTTPASAGDGDLRALLTEVRDTGLIYWEPNTERGAVNKAAMLARIDAALSRPAPQAPAEPKNDGSANCRICGQPLLEDQEVGGTRHEDLHHTECARPVAWTPPQAPADIRAATTGSGAVILKNGLPEVEPATIVAMIGEGLLAGRVKDPTLVPAIRQTAARIAQALNMGLSELATPYAPQAPAGSAGGESALPSTPFSRWRDRYRECGQTISDIELAKDAFGGGFTFGMEARAALAPTAKPEPAGREEIARIIDPKAFEDFEDLRDACIREGNTIEATNAVDLSRHGLRIANALAKADAILDARTVAEGVAGEPRDEDAVFVIIRMTGEYSDRSENVIAGTFDEAAARKWVEETQRVCQSLAEETNRKVIAADFEDEDKIRAEAKARCPDPDFDPWGGYAEDVRYFVQRVGLRLPSPATAPATQSEGGQV